MNISGSYYVNITAISSTEQCYPNSNVRVFVTVILLVAIFLSVTGNCLICVIVYRKAAMRSGINLLLANLAFADLLIAVTNFLFTLIVFNQMEWNFGVKFCYFNGILYQIIHCEKMLLLLIISIDRYFIIVKRKDTVTPYKAKLLILLSWLVSILISLPPVFGWGKYYYRCGDVQCVLDFQSNTSRSFVVFSETFLVIVPTIILWYVYHHILRTVRRNCFRVQNHPPVTHTAMHRKGKLFIDYGYKTRTSTTILLVCLVFIATTLPLGIVHLEMARQRSGYIKEGVYLTLLWISYLHGTIDPIIFYTFIKKFREAVREFLPHFFHMPKILPLRTKRRVRPHAVYSVDKKEVNALPGSNPKFYI